MEYGLGRIASVLERTQRYRRDDILCSSQACKRGANADEHGKRIYGATSQVMGESEIFAKEKETNEIQEKE